MAGWIRQELELELKQLPDQRRHNSIRKDASEASGTVRKMEKSEFLEKIKDAEQCCKEMKELYGAENVSIKIH